MRTFFAILFCLFFVQAQGQILGDLTKEATSMASKSLVESLAGDQVRSLTEKLGLSQAQQDQVTDLAIEVLSRPEVQKLVGDLAGKGLSGMGSSIDPSDVTKILSDQPDYTSGLKDILNKDQLGTLKDLGGF